jgi:hypothetical protein
MSISWGASLGVYQHTVGWVLGEISLAEASWSLDNISSLLPAHRSCLPNNIPKDHDDNTW